MKVFHVTALLVSLQVCGQESPAYERGNIYQHILSSHVDKGGFVINETFTPVNKYDIDGNFQRWFYQSFSDAMVVSVVPIRYESTIYDFLKSKNITLDTSSIFRQIDAAKLDSLTKYETAANIIPYTKAPLGHSFFSNLFKKKRAVGLSPIYFDEGSNIAFVKLHVFSKSKDSFANPSQIIILYKESGKWKTLGVLQQALQPTAVLQ